MTKAREPEFTDHKSALAFLGTAKQKATHDAWNTKAALDENGDIELQVGPGSVATFHKDGSITLTKPPRTGTVRERLNRYVFGPRGYEVNEKWMLSATIMELPGIGGTVVVSGPTPFSGDEKIEPDGTIAGVEAKALDKAGWTRAVNKWLKEAMDQLTGPGLPATGACPACAEDDWWDVSTTEHLLSHIIQPAYPGELLVRLLAPNADNQGGLVKFTGDRTFTEEATRRWLMNEIER